MVARLIPIRPSHPPHPHPPRLTLSIPSGPLRCLFHALLVVPIVTIFFLLLMNYFGSPQAEEAWSEDPITEAPENGSKAQARWERSFPAPTQEVIDDSMGSATDGAYSKPIDLGEFDREDIRCVHEQNANESWDGFDMALRKCAHSFCVQGLTVDAAMRRCTEESTRR